MNNAFRNKPYNPHVHWHLRPRYEKPIKFAGKTFTDPDSGEHYNYQRKEMVNEEMVQKIKRALENCLD